MAKKHSQDPEVSLHGFDPREVRVVSLLIHSMMMRAKELSQLTYEQLGQMASEAAGFPISGGYVRSWCLGPKTFLPPPQRLRALAHVAGLSVQDFVAACGHDVKMSAAGRRKTGGVHQHRAA